MAINEVELEKSFKETFGSNSYYGDNFSSTLEVTKDMLAIGDKVIISHSTFMVVPIESFSPKRVIVSFQRTKKLFDINTLELTKDTSSFNPWYKGKLLLPTLANWLKVHIEKDKEKLLVSIRNRLVNLQYPLGMINPSKLVYQDVLDACSTLDILESQLKVLVEGANG